jgi:amidase
MGRSSPARARLGELAVTDLSQLDAIAQAELVRRGDASPLELVDAAITGIEKLNPELNAVVHPLFDSARAAARGPLPDGPFRGVPTLFKDFRGAVEGDPYHEGMRFLKEAGWRADHTDALARRFLDAGFVCVGRTNTPELALLPTTEPQAYGPTHNPWDPSRISGGSSGGAAAAVASGMVPVAHANDGGGSIRIPASCCGLVGLKPSRGRTALGPGYDAVDDMLNVELCVSRSVRDTASVLDAVHGRSDGETVGPLAPARPFAQEVGADPGRLRIGLLVSNPFETGEIHADCVTAARQTAALLESLGHSVDQAHPAAATRPELVGHFTTIWSATRASSIRLWEQKLGREITADDVEPLTWAMAEMGHAVTAPDYLDAQYAMLDLARGMDDWFGSGFDLLLTPTMGEPPCPLGEFHTPEAPFLAFMRAATLVPFTPLANMAGIPAISLPLSWNAEQLPIGSQLFAAYGREDLLLRVASQLETARPWADRRPPVHI